MPSLSAYVALTALFVITPGASTALVFRSALEAGRAGGLLTASGIAVGNSTYAVAAGLGLSTLVTRHAGALQGIKLAGACYLIWLGLESLLRSRREWHVVQASGGTLPHVASHADAARLDPGHWFRQGVVTNLLNPAIPVFYASYVTQFVVPHGPFWPRFTLLSIIHVTMAFVVHSFYALTLGHAAGVLLRPRVRLGIQAFTGVALIVLGARMIW